MAENDKRPNAPERRSIENLGVDPVAVAEAASGVADVIGAVDNNPGAIVDAVKPIVAAVPALANKAKSDVGKAASAGQQAAKPMTVAHASIVEQLSTRSMPPQSRHRPSK